MQDGGNDPAPDDKHDAHKGCDLPQSHKQCHHDGRYAPMRHLQRLIPQSDRRAAKHALKRRNKNQCQNHY